MTQRPDLVVHVGLGAGARLVGSALPLLAPELARQGVRTVTGDGVVSVGGAPVLVTAPAPAVPTDPSDVSAFCCLQPADVAALIERSGARRARIVLSTERQDRLLERSYRDAVAEGFAGTLDDRFPRRLAPLLDYRPLAQQLRDLPHVLDVRVLPLELVAAGQIAYVGAVFAMLEPAQRFDLSALATWRVPREYGPRGLRIALAMVPHLDTDAELAKVRTYVRNTFSVPVGASPQLLAADERAAIVAAYRPANRALFTDVAPEFVPTSYSGRGGLAALGSALTPIDVRAPAGPRPPTPTGVRAARARLGRLRRRLVG